MTSDISPSVATRPRRWSLSLGRISGIDLRVHASFFVLLVLFAIAAPEPGIASALNNVAWLVAVFTCVVLHELGHCFVARARGATVDEILLFPLGGVSRLRNLPENPRDEFAIAVVGPMVSIGLGLLAIGLALATGTSLIPIDLLTGGWLAKLAWLNLMLGLFNLLPAFPLDGGRVLRSLLERTRDLESATRLATRVGHVLAGALIVVGLLFDFWLVIIGVFVYFGGSAEEAATIVHARLRGHRVRDAMDPDPRDVPRQPAVDADAPLDDDILSLVASTPARAVAVESHGHVVGVLRVAGIEHLVGSIDPHPVPSTRTS
jgi:Zn-dependent protease